MMGKYRFKIRDLFQGPMAWIVESVGGGLGLSQSRQIYLDLQNGQIRNPVLLILSILGYRAIILGSFGGPGTRKAGTKQRLCTSGLHWCSGHFKGC